MLGLTAVNDRLRLTRVSRFAWYHRDVAINLSVTTERVRSGARQIQSLIEGSRDRAIYAGEARGIRILARSQT